MKSSYKNRKLENFRLMRENNFLNSEVQRLKRVNEKKSLSRRLLLAVREAVEKFQEVWKEA